MVLKQITTFSLDFHLRESGIKKSKRMLYTQNRRKVHEFTSSIKINYKHLKYLWMKWHTINQRERKKKHNCISLIDVPKFFEKQRLLQRLLVINQLSKPLKILKEDKRIKKRKVKSYQFL